MKKILALVLSLIFVLGMCQIAMAEDDSQLLVGAAIRDVTPTKENGMLPIAGIGRDAGPIVDVIMNVYTRVLAFQQGGETALLVCTETGKGPTGWQYAAELSEHTGIPVDAIFYTTTHTHSVPEQKKEVALEPVEGEEVDTKTLWSRYVLEQMKSAADEALANLQPVNVSIAYGESYINTNRNRTYTRHEDGSTYVELGYNPTGVVDRTLTVLKFDGLDGNTVAYLVNYPMHCVTMIANTYFDGQTGIHPDVCGIVSNLLETKDEGAVAVWTSGAAGDLNPIMSNQMMYPDPLTGELVTTYTGELLICETLAYIHYDDILVAMQNLEPVDTDYVKVAYGTTQLPNVEGSEAEYTELALKVLSFGDELAFVGSPNELYNSLGTAIKENSSVENTIVFNHVWTQKAESNGYILDDEARVRGGYGGGKLAYKTGYIAGKLSALANDLLAEAAE